MTPIDFGMKGQGHGALNVRMVSAHYFGHNLSQSLYISHID
jgi:hypothetical protein